MRPNSHHFRKAGVAAFVATLISILGMSVTRADVITAALETPTGIKYLVVLDSASQKAYIHAAGPVNRWFGWGFGETYMGGYGIIFNAGANGNVYESNIETYVGAPPQASQNISASSCTIGSTIYYTVIRDLQTTDPNDYVFSMNPGLMNTIWAMGDSVVMQYHGANRSPTTMTAATAPQPKVTSVSRGFGTTTLTITNLPISLTNKVQFTTDLGTTNWTTVSNLVFSSTCGPLVFDIFTNKTVTVSATNSAGFYRIKQ